MPNQEMLCIICNKLIPKNYSESKSINHIFPTSKGELHEMSNCQAAHFVCNNRKKAKVGKEFNNG